MPSTYVCKYSTVTCYHNCNEEYKLKKRFTNFHLLIRDALLACTFKYSIAGGIFKLVCSTLKNSKACDEMLADVARRVVGHVFTATDDKSPRQRY